MSPRPEFTLADAERARRDLQRCPAASAYGDHLRRGTDRDPYAREAERVRTILATVADVTPADEVAAGEREVRRAMMQRFRS